MRKLAALALVAASVFFAGGERAASARRPRGGYIQTPAKSPVVYAETPRIIYMNRHGGTFYGTYNGSWDEDATTNHSSIFSGTASLPEYPYGDASWNSVMSCMREIYAPFNIEITDADPGTAAHIESVVAGSPGMIGMDDYTGGVAPYSCDVINYAIVYSFPTVWGNDPRAICETAAQETAHAFGLDHEFLCEDPMTYLFGCGDKHFQNIDADCGEDGPRSCSCGGTKQNSVRALLSILGPRDATEPSVQITFPQDGSSVQAGFRVDVNAMDQVGIRQVELFIDGAPSGVDESFPFGFMTSDTIGEGDHELLVRAINYADLLDEQTIRVNVKPPCQSTGECDQGNVCVAGTCLPGPDNPGGLGAECTAATDCYTGRCDTDGDAWRCTQGCDPAYAQEDCPGGFDCYELEGGSGFCWPGASVLDNKGCCAVVGAAPEKQRVPWLTMSALALAGVLLIRRRNRRSR